MIRFRCSHCGQKIKIQDVHAGKKGKCPKCKNVLTVPSPQVAPAQTDSVVSMEKFEQNLLGTSLSQKRKSFYMDQSFWSLILSNLVVIVLALAQDWSLFELMWVYWAQSVLIGFFWFLKIITLKDFSTRNVTINHQPLDETNGAKFTVGFFFLVHFGGFHLGYFFLLHELFDEQSKSIAYSSFWIMILLLLINQFFTFVHNLKKSKHERPNLGKLMMFPYARVIPMHLTILLGGLLEQRSLEIHLLIFLLLKLLADVLMYAVELGGFQDKFKKVKSALSQKNPSKIPKPPRNIPFFIKVLILLGSPPAQAGLILFSVSVVVYLAELHKDNQNPIWMYGCLLGPCVLLFFLFISFRYIQLVKNGQVGLAKVIDIEEKVSRSRKGRSRRVKYKITYEFLADDGNTYTHKVSTSSPSLLWDEDYEIIFYHDRKPSKAVLLDYLPGELNYDESGQLFISRPEKALLHLLPVVVVTVGLIIAYSMGAF